MAFVLGITGGIATGKSSVVQHFIDLGFPVVDADIIARHLLDQNEQAYNEVVKIFGSEILQENGEINRQALGALVFNHPDKLKQLDELMAPFLQESILAAIKQASQNQKLVIVDVPLMYEKGYDEWMDQVAVVYCTPNQQLKRLMQRNQLTEKEAKQRIDSQLPIEMKKLLAEVVFDNSNDLTQTIQQVDTWLSNRKYI
ncbi:dephospho-CoA kinase [Enterococcus cecorum]|uniref:Dephospho-CoA kinase n=1 Tax=Enterococcus cecorum TaxID=44008 RepID=A0A200I285_9ENTE|nr:dephospho-CoA kinase [Enterococcus cecorum]MBM6935151.1 dephospho-CoA kinase [Enterococcus cecorum]MCJ0553331.1 dephospho-CoA kinase [Enterococcus cecorum]MCJ0557935.1 dephospho-CoA kinase [Enterococcus cecorum]MCJ0562273.1 dephospho-CoA kinase [Enterococcus cecorum]MCJ0564906.1 dephospho-CoA kinase [Enterococcus cecorum]